MRAKKLFCQLSEYLKMPIYCTSSGRRRNSKVVFASPSFLQAVGPLVCSLCWKEQGETCLIQNGCGMDCSGHPTGLQSKGLGSSGGGDCTLSPECSTLWATLQHRLWVTLQHVASDVICRVSSWSSINNFMAHYCVNPASLSSVSFGLRVLSIYGEI